MSNKSRLSLLGMYRFNNDLFDFFNFPSAWNDTDKSTFVNNLLMETAELEIIYTDYDFLKNAIALWSTKELPVWESLYNTTQFEYNPIWNKDGTITETRTIKGTHSTNQNETSNANNTENSNTTGKVEVSGSVNRSANSSDNESTTSNTASEAESLHSVYGYNGSAEAPADKTDNTGKESGSGTRTSSSTGSENATTTNNEDRTSNYNKTGTEKSTREELENGSHEETETYTRVEKGNIGITTTQSMIIEEREVVKFNLMNYIIDSFIHRFCILIY